VKNRLCALVPYALIPLYSTQLIFLEKIRLLLKIALKFVITQAAVAMADMPFEEDEYKRIVFSVFSLQWITDKSK
jgi:hypothetical protein